MTKKSMKATHVVYAATAQGYKVMVWNNAECLEEYTAGNHPQDSQVFIPPTDPITTPEHELAKMAHQTALHMAKEYNVPPCMIEYSTDILEEGTPS